MLQKELIVSEDKAYQEKLEAEIERLSIENDKLKLMKQCDSAMIGALEALRNAYLEGINGNFRYNVGMGPDHRVLNLRLSFVNEKDSKKFLTALVEIARVSLLEVDHYKDVNVEPDVIQNLRNKWNPSL